MFRGKPEGARPCSRRPPKCKKPNREGWAKCKIHNKILWLLDLGSNQGPTD